MSNKSPAGIPAEFSFDEMRFCWVEVVSQGIVYRGVLIGADDKDVYLRGALRWLILPLDRITSIKLEGAKETFNPIKQVGSDFYSQAIDE